MRNHVHHNGVRVNKRYHIILTSQIGPTMSIQVLDRVSDSILIEWNGIVVLHLFESGVLPIGILSNGYHACDKSFVWHLILAGTAVKIGLDQNGTRNVGISGRSQSPCSELLTQRLNNHGQHLSELHMLIAKVIFAHPDNHFCEIDILCLLLLEYTSFEEVSITSQLEDLALWNLVQRIEVDIDNVFFDINTTPHLHIFDPNTRLLRDAPQTGVIFPHNV